MTRSLAAALAAAVVALSAAGAWAAKPNRRTVPVAELPAWVREAAAAPAPPTDAAGVVLHDETIVQPLVEGGVRVTRRWIARALKRGALAGLDGFALQYRKDDRLPELRGWTIAPDGRTAAIPDPVVDRRDVPWTDGISVADDVRLRSLAAANPVVGATFASESSVVHALDFGAAAHVFGTARWPVLRSRLVLRAPEGWSVGWSASGLGDVPCAEEGTTLTCEAENLEPLPQHEARPPADELLATVWARWFSPDGSRGFRDWDGLARWYDALTAPVLSDVGDLPKLAQALGPKTPDDLGAAVERAFDFVSRDVRYVSLAFGIGGVKPHPPSLALSRKFGDCKDKTFLLRAILARWGLRTVPVLVRHRDDGVVDPDAPSVGQFNHVIAGIVLPEAAFADRWVVTQVEGVGRVLLLDGTAGGSSPWTLPAPDQGTLALVVLPEGGRLVTLPVQPPEAESVERTLDASIDETGSLRTAELDERRHDAAGARFRAGWAAVGDLEKRRLHEAWLQSRFPGSSLASYTVEGLDRAGATVVQRSTLRGGWFGKRVGAMLIVSPGRAGGGLYGEPLPAEAPWGVRDVPREERVDASVTLPPGFAPEALPGRVEVKAAGVEGSAEWEFREDRLRYRRTARLTTSAVRAADYASFRDAVRRLDAADATAVVFVKAAP